MRTVLMYHSIDDSGSPISINAATFEAQLDWLTREGVGILPLDDLIGVGSGKGGRTVRDYEHCVALTFDDALESVYAVAYPILESRGLVATVFVPTGAVARDNRWRAEGDRGIPTFPVLGWDRLRKLQNSGWELGAHSRTHKPMVYQPSDSLAQEIAGSGEDLQRETGITPRFFAYPYGVADAPARAATARGFDFAFTTEQRSLPAGDGAADWHPPARSDAAMQLPRIDAWYLQNPSLMRGWGSAVQQLYLRLRGALSSARSSYA